MKNVNLLFPGQGSQYVGMAKDILQKEEHKQIIEQANSALGFSITDIMLNGPEEKLKMTEYTQPAILLHSYLLFLELSKCLEQNSIQIDTVLGHSVGEYAALVASKSLDFAEAIKAVHLRGKYMQEAVPPGEGKMVAILKLNIEKINEACHHCSKENEKVMPANFNGPSQIVVSGHASACDRLLDWLKENVDSPYRAVPLKVSAPFHSSLMLPASEKLKEHFKEVTFHKNQIPYIANIDAKKYEKNSSENSIKNNLVQQVSGSVLWSQSFSSLSENITCYEVGPGKTLMGLGRSINRNIKITPIDGVELPELFS